MAKSWLSPGFQTVMIGRKNWDPQIFPTGTPYDHYIQTPCQIWRCWDNWKLVKSRFEIAPCSDQAVRKCLSPGFQTLKNCRSPGSNVCCSSHMSLPIYTGDGLAQKFCQSPGFQTSKIDWKFLKSQKISTRTPMDHYTEAPCQIWRCCDDWNLVFTLVICCKNYLPLWPPPAILTPTVLMPKS